MSVDVLLVAGARPNFVKLGRSIPRCRHKTACEERSCILDSTTKRMVARIGFRSSGMGGRGSELTFIYATA